METSLLMLVNIGLVAFAAVVALTVHFRRVAIAVGFVDRPGGRKDHETVVPPIGGLVIFPVFVVLSLATGMDIAEHVPLFMALALLLAVGALDDHFDIRASIKFSIQFIAAWLIVVPGGATIEHLGNFLGFGVLYTGFLGVPFTIFCVMLLINAINMMDGLDGLAGGKSIIIMLWLAIAAAMGGDEETLVALVVLMGTLAGFLYFNMRTPLNKRATVFLGDSGSMSLGLVLAWFAITMTHNGEAALAPISVAWIMAVPVIDAFGLFVIRIVTGRHPFSADRNHFHHHFVHAGVPVGQSTITILAIGYSLGLIGYCGVRAGVPEYVLTYIWIGLLLSHTWLTVRSQKFIAFLARLYRCPKAGGTPSEGLADQSVDPARDLK